MLTSEFYLFGGLGALAFFTVIALMLRAFGKRRIKGFKKPVKTVGTVEKFHPETSSADCSYTDNRGERRTAGFQIIGKRFKKGDEIAICFDAEDPGKAVPESTLKAGKHLWLKFLFITVAVIAGILLVLALLDHFGILEKIWRYWYVWRWNRRYHH